MNSKTCIKCEISKTTVDFDNKRNICKICRYADKKDRISSMKHIKVNEKECITCNKTLSITLFNKRKANKDGYNNVCKICYSDKRKESQTDSIIKIIIQTKVCRICNTNKDISEYRKTNKSNDGHFSKCNSCWEPIKWNKEKQKLSELKYIANNKDKIKEKWRKRGQQTNVRIRNSLNHRISGALQSQNNRKSNKTIDYIGCDISQLKLWFEYLFEDGMTFDNYGEWHIDHIKPCSSFDLNNDEDIKQCFHWSNIRPCWAIENLQKGDILDDKLIDTYKNKMNEFILKYPLPTHPGNRVEGTE